MSFGSKTTTDQKQTASSTPVEQKEWTGLRDQLISMAMNKLQSNTDMGGYEAGGINKINNAFDSSTIARDNALSARGLSSSPIAGNADILAQNSRAGDIASFQNSIPLLQRDIANQDWTQALNLFNPRPMGSSSKGTMSGVTEENKGFGSILTGLAGGLGQMIGGGYLKGLFGGGGKSEGLTDYENFLMGGGN